MNFGPPWMSAISSNFSPDPPVNGGVVDYVEQDKVLTPVRMQVEIESVHWYSGDGSCAQAPMEMWVSIGTGGTAAAALGGMNETASSPTPTPAPTATPTPAPAPSAWVYSGIGDCLGHDVGKSSTPAPDPSMCRPGASTAVCWDGKTYINKGENSVWCTYKNVTVAQCNENGPNPARMYSCQNAPTATSVATPTPTATPAPTPKPTVAPTPTPNSSPVPTPTGTTSLSKPCPDNPAALELQVCHIVAEPGAAIDVPIYLLKSTNLANLNLELRYDGAVVKTAGKAKIGPMLNASQELFESNPNQLGLVKVGFAGTAGVAGSGILAYVPFTVVGAAGSHTVLDIKDTAADAASGAVAKLLLASGDIVVEAPPPPPPVFTALDALKALQMSVGLLPPDMTYDLDKSGQITSNDARLILARVVGH